MSASATTTTKPKPTNYINVSFYGTPTYYNEEKDSWSFNVTATAANRINAALDEAEIPKRKRFNLTSDHSVSRPTYLHPATEQWRVTGKVFKKKDRSPNSFIKGKTYTLNARCTWYDYEETDTDTVKYGWWMGITISRLEEDQPHIGEEWTPEPITPDIIVDADEDLSALSGTKKRPAPAAKSSGKPKKPVKADPKQKKLTAAAPPAKKQRTGKKAKPEEEEYTPVSEGEDEAEEGTDEE